MEKITYAQAENITNLKDIMGEVSMSFWFNRKSDSDVLKCMSIITEYGARNVSVHVCMVSKMVTLGSFWFGHYAGYTPQLIKELVKTFGELSAGVEVEDHDPYIFDIDEDMRIIRRMETSPGG